jgi:ABC-type sugar transport system ATPase subunit
MSEIRLVNLTKEFKEVVAVRNVTITFPASVVTCLLGPSGCGKTTLLRMIAGLEEPTAGDVYFNGERVTNLPPSRRNIGMVFQYPVVYPGVNVYRNIELPLLEERLTPAERRQRIEEVIEVLGLKANINDNITELDIGTHQRVAVARTVARQPDIILFDEPLTNVDVKTRAELKRALKQLTKRLKRTVIYVTHDQTDAMTLADEIALMKEGEIVQRDSPRVLYDHPSDVFGGWFLGNPGMNFFTIDVERRDGGGVLNSPLFSAPVQVTGIANAQQVRLGIRPEKVRAFLHPNAQSVMGEVVRKSVVVGGQYLLVVKVGEQNFKVKVRPELGPQIQKDVWIELPLGDITVFGTEGQRLEARLSLPSLSAALT